MAFYLGIDIGTSAVKVILLDEAQREHALAARVLSVQRPAPGFSEQSADDWWQAVDSAVSEIAAKCPIEIAAVRAIGLSGQMHGLVPLDSQNTPLRPAILWNDTRASIEAAELAEAHPEFATIGGNLVMAGFTAPKAVWMARHEPELFAKIKTILLPKDYVRFCLTGAKISDMSDASGTLWLDIAKRCWSQKLLGFCGLQIAQMPKLVEGSAVSATLLPALAQKWGMSPQVVVAGGAGDNAAAAVGLGLRNTGEGFVSLGTSGVVFKITDGFAERADKAVHAFCHALPNSWHQMGVILSASDSLSWLCAVTGQELEALFAQMKSEDSDKCWPLFHPYLSGERTPHNDASAKGGFFSLSRTDDAGDLTRAVLQGTAFAMADAMAVLDDARGQQTLIATGGGAKNAYWMRLIASLTGCEIAVPKNTDIGAALGAARLAMLADQMTLACVCTPPEVAYTIQPDTELAAKLAPAHQFSRQLYHLISKM
jgi:xylulokinase